MSPLNSYFIQGSSTEQRLIQDLINEQIKMYGQDILYLPRKIINKKTIIKEIVASKFDDAYRIEAYLINFQGFGGQGDILSKFGVQTTDQITLAVSKERYEDFISPFLTGDAQIQLSTRPQEGDLIYLPLDNTIFEIKYVEAKSQFYQLNNLYIYELRCEVFDYESDDLIATDIIEVDESVKDFGYITTINMVGTAATIATGAINIAPNPSVVNGGSVTRIDLINDGTGYTNPPEIKISPPISGGINATAVAIMTNRSEQKGSSIDKILIVNPGIGYTVVPLINIISNTGSGAIATAIVAYNSLGPVQIINKGNGYTSPPIVSISSAPSGGIDASAVASINQKGEVISVNYVNSGSGYTMSPTISFSSPIGISSGNYKFNQMVRGVSTGTTAYVSNWDFDKRELQVKVTSGTFVIGETIIGIGTTSGDITARYKVFSIQREDEHDAFSENIAIQDESDNILDFSERNPFGEY